MNHLKYDIKTLFKFGRRLLNSDIEVELIIRNSLYLKKEEFYLNLNKEIDRKNFKEIFKKFYLRKKGVPLSYITNKKIFLDLEIEVLEGVFIPRFETEEIIYQILKKYEKVNKTLDICSGTGAIGVSLLFYNFTESCTFVDIDEKALENIKINLEKYKLNGKIIKSDMFSNVNEKYDLIISNPPYIKEEEYENLPIDVKMEPKLSLIGGEDGIKYIKILFEESYKFLDEKGLLIVEMEKEELDYAKKFLNFLKIKEILKTESENIIGVVLEKM
ncbi:MAG: peptide chain release factor N(5)-glutamine methyltransferase [Caldisericia bacterium]|nr:peptide chain release factor N(5)-glutamine methyltransferase [Caldisericia bacterium]